MTETNSQEERIYYKYVYEIQPNPRKKMKPFDLEKAKAGHPVCTKMGEPVKIIYFDAVGVQPIIGLLDDRLGNEVPYTWSINGEFASDDDSDLMMQEESVCINGHKVPKPMDKPPSYENRAYYIPNISSIKLFDWIKWTGGMYDKRHLKRGVAHSTKEAAIAHAKALLSFTREII